MKWFQKLFSKAGSPDLNPPVEQQELDRKEPTETIEEPLLEISKVKALLKGHVKRSDSTDPVEKKIEEMQNRKGAMRALENLARHREPLAYQLLISFSLTIGDDDPMDDLAAKAFWELEKHIFDIINAGPLYDLDNVDPTEAEAFHKVLQSGMQGQVANVLEKSPQLLHSVVNRAKPFHVACVTDSVNVMKDLLDAGEHVNVRAGNGVTALQLAAATGKLAVVEFLLANDANVNLMGLGYSNRYTPLHVAVAGGHTAIVIKLVDHGAFPKALDENGMTPKVVAEAKNYTELASYFENLT